MRRFQFRLESALRVRRFREEQAQLELAAAQRRLGVEEAAYAQILAEIERHTLWRASVQSDELDIRMLTDAARYEEKLAEVLERQRETVSAETLEAEKHVEIVRRIHADREALERLRERRLADHYQEALASEQQDIDEASVLRWPRT
jgi:flagellar FliJ protein